MAHEGRPARWEEVLAPRPLLLGAALTFLACCAAGHFVSGRNYYVAFERFHWYINPQGSYYPTASQVRALGKSTLDPEKVIVVVGGNSVLHGETQGPTTWTRTLQELLGPRYQVINLALCGALPAEFGGTSAEILSRDHPRLILVTNTWPGAGSEFPDGFTYRYFFWDAWYKGLIGPDPRRAARLAELDAARAGDETFAELKRRARLDAPLRFEDLWTSVAYRHFCTVWVRTSSGTFLRPRKRCPDIGKVPLPPGAYYTPGPDTPPMRAVRALIPADAVAEAARGAPPGPPPPGPTPLGLSFRQSIPEFLWGHTLVLVNHHSPYYVAQLTPAERTAYSWLFPRTVRDLETSGFAALEVSKDCTESDFVDHCHLTATGAVRLAEEVAPRVRELAGRLGYLE